MLKKTCLVLVLLSGQLMAMKPNPAFGVCALTDTVPGPLMEVHHVIAPVDKASSHMPNSWANLIKQAYGVMQKGTISEQYDFFGSVKEYVFAFGNNNELKEDCRPYRLIVMALFFRHTALKNQDCSVWQTLGEHKSCIDNITGADILPEEHSLISCLLKGFRGCTTCVKKDVLCATVCPDITHYVRHSVVGHCCKTSYSSGIICDLCTTLLKRRLNAELKELVVGFHQFGFPLNEPEHKALVKWALLHKSY